MKIVKKILKWVFISLFSLIAIVLLIATLFVQLNPQFGAAPTDEQKLEYSKTNHYKDGIFVNLTPSEMNVDMIRFFKEYFKEAPDRNPKQSLPVHKIDSLEIINHVALKPRLTWFGHSAFLLEIDNHNILLDPMLSDVAAPHPWLGQKRYQDSLPLEIEQIPYIDLVIFSHDHYDHLDYETILKIKDKVGAFYVPLAVGNHLKYWGVEPNKVHELDWWQEIQHDNLLLACTPARHFSGRGLTYDSQTLWASWVIKSKNLSIFFSGDGGYADHFKEIGDKYGPFDLGLMECGQYNEDWHAIHMFPEETAIAGKDICAKRIVPIHWGAFTLALHAWTDPVERVITKANELELPITTPQVGESFTIDGEGASTNNWWENY